MSISGLDTNWPFYWSQFGPKALHLNVCAFPLAHIRLDTLYMKALRVYCSVLCAWARDILYISTFLHGFSTPQKHTGLKHLSHKNISMIRSTSHIGTFLGVQLSFLPNLVTANSHPPDSSSHHMAATNLGGAMTVKCFLWVTSDLQMIGQTIFCCGTWEQV